MGESRENTVQKHAPKRHTRATDKRREKEKYREQKDRIDAKQPKGKARKAILGPILSGSFLFLC
jgi:hypothetical protein